MLSQIFLTTLLNLNEQWKWDENGIICSNSQVYVTGTIIDSVKFNNDTVKRIRKLDKGEADGHDNITIYMIKLCDSAIEKSLSIIYKNCTFLVNFQTKA